jgi:bifunctional enzyme CysN/CysC
MNIAIDPELFSHAEQRPLVRIVIVGHVDHGKSTLIGRLLHETGSLPDGKLDHLKAVSARRGMPFEWSFLLDALQNERDQGITIDTSQIRFQTASRDFVLIDAPGHVEFLRNMITGAAQADAALLMVDATEGVREQTRRHGYLLHLLGIRQIAVVINKMDRIGYSATRFHEIAVEIDTYLSDLGLKPIVTIPVSAREGDGVALKSASLAWYEGPTVLQVLDQFSPATPLRDLSLRLPVQTVYKFDDRRIIAGRIESGEIVVGDDILVMPGNKTARVRSIESWPEPCQDQPIMSAAAGYSTGITLDREVFVQRGDIIARVSGAVPVSRRIRARIFWLHPTSLVADASIVLRLGTSEIRGRVSAIANTLDPGALQSETRNAIPQNHVGEIDIELTKPLAADRSADNPATGRFAIESDGRIVGGGLILDLLDGPRGHDKIRLPDSTDSRALQRQADALTPRMAALTAADRIKLLRDSVTGPIVFTTSFGIEDQAVLEMIAHNNIDIDVVTLDTGRLFPETYDLWAQTERHFGRRIRAVYPRHEDLQAHVERHGINGFYTNRETRLACCFVRKVEPLERTLIGANGWIAGLRADQSAERADMALIAADAAHHLLKLNPIFDWSREQAVAFTASQGVPVSALHDRGFASIGCAPCTRALRSGEPERAGRWWWEDTTKKECGLHERQG